MNRLLHHISKRLTATILIVVAGIYMVGCSIDLDGRGNEQGDSKVSFALSLKVAGGERDYTTKMGTDVTQSSGNASSFRGIEEVFVIPFSDATVLSTSERLGERNVVLQQPGISLTWSQSAGSGLVESNNSHLFDLAIMPRGMQGVLAYGKAPGAATTVTTKHQYGVLTPANTGGLVSIDHPSEITFSLEQIASGSDSTAIYDKADALISALNGVASALKTASDNDAALRTIMGDFVRENHILACSYPVVSQMKSLLETSLGSYSGGTDISTVNTALTAVATQLTSAGENFPATYGIPEGTIGMSWNGSSFIRLISGVNVALVPMQSYCYPPSLWYHVNSAIQTTDSESVKEQYVSTNTTWDSILSTYYTSGGTVQNATRSVAIVNPLQYGVGLLALNVSSPGSGASGASGCPLTGIIVGEQKDVAYDFSPKTAVSRFVYDNSIPSGATLGGTATSVPLLLLQTVDGSKVHFALEFQNNTGSTLMCQQGDILPGCMFYLAGVLDPQSPSSGSIASVIRADYLTSVNVQVTSLESAYNTVPDLRDPQLEIGVVTQMKWMQSTPAEVSF